MSGTIRKILPADLTAQLFALLAEIERVQRDQLWAQYVDPTRAPLTYEEFQVLFPYGKR
jgi:hypothetical protein